MFFASSLRFPLRHIAPLAINLNLQLRVANQTALSTFRTPRNFESPSVSRYYCSITSNRRKIYEWFVSKSKQFMYIYTNISSIEVWNNWNKILSQRSKIRENGALPTVDRTVSLRHWLRKTCSYRARGEPFNDGTHNGLSVQWRIPLLFSLLACLPSSLPSTLSGNKKLTLSLHHTSLLVSFNFSSKMDDLELKLFLESTEEKQMGIVYD